MSGALCMGVSNASCGRSCRITLNADMCIRATCGCTVPRPKGAKIFQVSTCISGSSKDVGAGAISFGMVYTIPNRRIGLITIGGTLIGTVG